MALAVTSGSSCKSAASGPVPHCRKCTKTSYPRKEEAQAYIWLSSHGYYYIITSTRKSSLQWLHTNDYKLLKHPICSPWDVKIFMAYSLRSKIQGVVLRNPSHGLQTHKHVRLSLCLTTAPWSGAKSRIIIDLGTRWRWGVNWGLLNPAEMHHELERTTAVITLWFKSLAALRSVKCFLTIISAEIF